MAERGVGRAIERAGGENRGERHDSAAEALADDQDVGRRAAAARRRTSRPMRARQLGISSKISSAPCRAQESRTRGQNSAGGAATVVQRNGSAINAATSPWTSSE